MQIAGERIKRTRLIQTERFVVAVDVEMVIPPDDPSEPCYEAETVQFLREVKEHAEQGDLDWLQHRGKVYAAVKATA
ncbi:MAG: hypothetical protein IT425_00795 [Pirellulales bacterium]|nr:hypothetical protein [Pirellulales bacterium]